MYQCRRWEGWILSKRIITGIAGYQIRDQLVCRAAANHGPMMDPPGGAPEPHPTNTQGTANPFSLGNFEPLIVPRKRRSPRHGEELVNTARSNPEFADLGDHGGRVTTKEIRQLINNLKEIITHQTAVIESTKADLVEVKHDQNTLKTINEQLQEEVRTLREEIKVLTSTSPTRSWAAVAAGIDHTTTMYLFRIIANGQAGNRTAFESAPSALTSILETMTTVAETPSADTSPPRQLTPTFGPPY